MKVSVSLLLVVGFCLVIGLGECRRRSPTSRCVPRVQRKMWQRKMLPAVQCMKPKLRLVPLPVPDDYEWVFPNVVQVMQCKGHLCQRGWQCIGKSYTNRTFTVEGMKKNALDKTCVSFTVPMDKECECRCVTQPSDCSPGEEYDFDRCRCVCQKALEINCLNMMKKKPGMFMWSSDTCSCPCNNAGQACSSGTSWVPEHCSCRITKALQDEDI